MTALEKYLDRVNGIDVRMRAWIMRDKRRLRHASCRCWLDPIYRAVEVTQDIGFWRIHLLNDLSEVLGDYLRKAKS